jgi:O-antigen ligase
MVIQNIAARKTLTVMCFLTGAMVGLFYYKYVPLVIPFQVALIPVLLLVFISTIISSRAGTLFFIFSFPLINNLPYFFGIAEPLPFAPTALVLCLIYLWARLIGSAIKGPVLPRFHPIFRPISLFAGLVIMSALITFLRYANYFPFSNDNIYELTTNMHGVTSGGAIMSVIFTALGYLTGIGVFLALITTLNTPVFIKQAIRVLAISTGLSLLFAAYQHFGNPTLGNNPISINANLINGTFKDAMSFGAYLAMTASFFAAAAFGYRKGMRAICIALFFLSIYFILFAGSKIGFLVLPIIILFYGILLVSQLIKQRRIEGRKINIKKQYRLFTLTASIIFASLIVFLGITYKDSIIKTIVSSPTIERIWASRTSVLTDRTAHLWPQAVFMIKDYPLSGVGIGGYIIEASNYAKDKNIPIVILESVENSALQIWSELGLIGLVATAWIFWKIIRQIVRLFKSKPSSPSDRNLIIGLSGGILAYVLISFFHTFIWSYEIKYTFWLLVGLLFCLKRPDEGNEKPRRFKKKEIVIGLIVILVFSTIHLWNSTHSLSLESRTAKYGFNREFGLDKLEKTADGRDFRWTREYGGIPIKIEKPALSLPIHASHPDIQAKPVRIEIYIFNGFFKHKKFLKEITLSRNDWQDVALTVPPEDVGRDVIILLKISRTWVPLKVTGAPDPRHLGVAVGKIEFKD